MNEMDKYQIRQETKNDYTNIYNLIKKAFETAEVKDGDEQDYAANLRESNKYIPELALVAEKDGELIGHIMFTRFNVIKTDGSIFTGLLVAPLSVKLECRNSGVGSALMKEGLKLAKLMKYTAAFLCGSPKYYNRFGFIESQKFGITNVNDIPDQNSLAYELINKALEEVSGTINFL